MPLDFSGQGTLVDQQPDTPDFSAQGTPVQPPSTDQTSPAPSSTLGGIGTAAGQSFGEAISAIPSSLGAVVQGAAKNTEDLARQQIGIMDQIDAGGKIPPGASPTDYAYQFGQTYAAADPEMRAAIRKNIASSVADIDQNGNPGTQAAAAISEVGNRISEGAESAFPLTPEEQSRFSVKATKAVIGLTPIVGAAIAGGVPAAVGVAGLEGYGQHFDAAKKNGASDEDASTAGLLGGLANAGLMTLPLGQAMETMAALPAAVKSSVIKGVVEMAKSGTVLTAFSQIQNLVDNAIAKGNYAPDQSMTQGLGNDLVPTFIAGMVLPGVGAAVGGAARAVIRAKGVDEGAPAQPTPENNAAQDVMAADNVDDAIAAAQSAVGGPVDTDTLIARSQALGASVADIQAPKLVGAFAGLNLGEVQQVGDDAYQLQTDTGTIPVKVWDENESTQNAPDDLTGDDDVDNATQPTIPPDVAAAQREHYGQLGVDVVFYQNDPNIPFDGMVDPQQPDTLFLSNDPSRNAIQVGAHEITHVLADTTLPDGTNLGDLLKQQVAQGLTSEGWQYADQTFGDTAPDRTAFPAGPEGDEAHSDAVYSHLINEMGADIGGEAPKFQTFMPAVLNEVENRYGPTVAQSIMQKFMAGIQSAMETIRSFFGGGHVAPDDWQGGQPPTISQNLVTNLGEIHDTLAKMYAAKYGTQIEREQANLNAMSDAAARDRFLSEGNAEPDVGNMAVQAPEPELATAPAGGITEAPAAPASGQASAIRDLETRALTYRRWLGQLTEANRGRPPTSDILKLRTALGKISDRLNDHIERPASLPLINEARLRSLGDEAALQEQATHLRSVIADTPVHPLADVARERLAKVQGIEARMADPNLHPEMRKLLANSRDAQLAGGEGDAIRNTNPDKLRAMIKGDDAVRGAVIQLANVERQLAEVRDQRAKARSGLLFSPKRLDDERARLGLRPRAWVAFSQALDRLKSGAMESHEVLPMGRTPPALRLGGLPDLPLVYRQAEARKTLLGKHAGTIDEETLRRLPDALANPILTYRQADGRIVALIKSDAGRDVISVVQPSAQIMGRVRNAVVTTHVRENPKAILDAIRDGRVTYRHQKKSEGWLRQSGGISEITASTGVNQPQERISLNKDQGTTPGLRFDKRVPTEAQIVKKYDGEGQPQFRLMFSPRIVEATSRYSNLSPGTARVKAAEDALRETRGSYQNRDTGWSIDLTRQGILKSLHGDGSAVRAEIAANLPSLIENATLTSSESDRANRPGMVAFHKLNALFNLDGRLNNVKLTVRELHDGRKIHYAVDHFEVGEGSEPDRKVAPAGGVAEAPLRPEAQPGSGDKLDQRAEEIKTSDDEPRFSPKINRVERTKEPSRTEPPRATEKVAPDDIRGKAETTGLADRAIQAVRDSIPGRLTRRLISPGTFDDSAVVAARNIRSELGQAYVRDLRTRAMLDEAVTALDDTTPETRERFAEAVDTGNYAGLSPEMRRFAENLKAETQAATKRLQSLGVLENAKEDYLGRLWRPRGEAEGPETAHKVLAALTDKRPLTGNKSFLKQRFYDTYAEARATGLEPVFENPAEGQLAKLAAMNRFDVGTRLARFAKEAGYAQLFNMGETRPDGWIELEGPEFQRPTRIIEHPDGTKVALPEGAWFAPEGFARVFNNFQSKGLEDTIFRDPARAARKLGNAINQLQLGLSVFHLTFTTLDAQISRIAAGIDTMAAGHIAKGAKQIAVAATPYNWYRNLRDGDRLIKGILGVGDEKGAIPPEMQDLVDAFGEGGGRVWMDGILRPTDEGPIQFHKQAGVVASLLSGYGKAIRTAAMKYPGTGVAARLRQTLNIVGRTLETTAAPMFEYIVPRQKLGVFSILAKDWIERHPDAASVERTAAMQDIWESIDNRLGQMVYDNLFWHKTLKDIAFISTRSVGWNMGSIREIGGGIAETGKFVLSKAAGRDAEWSRRTSYLIALPAVTALYGAIYNYLATGQGPQELKDYLFPRTGGTRLDGSPERIVLPTYIKDIYSWATRPAQTAQNKASPLISLTGEALQNRDFYGDIIANRDDPLVKQVGDALSWAAKSVTPFSIQGSTRMFKDQGRPTWESVLGAIGVQPAPAYIANPGSGARFEARQHKADVTKKARRDARQDLPAATFR